MDNITALINMLKASKNPKMLIETMLPKNNPMVDNILFMANSGNASGLETFARNLCKERGIDADEMINNIRRMI